VKKRQIFADCLAHVAEKQYFCRQIQNKTMQKSDLRIVFMGTPEFAVETLKALVENDYQVVAVVTQPDKPVGRHQNELQPSEVKKYALAHGLPVLQPEKMKDPQFIEQLRSYNANLQVVVAFRMLPEVVWAMPEYGTFNVHAALLPQYRGAAPINWAVINGETETGVTTFFLDHDIDTGRIIMQLPFAIPDDADVEYVYDGLMHLGADICLQTLDRILAADGHPESYDQLRMENGELTIRNTFAGKNINEESNHNSPFSILHSPLKPAPKIFKETCQIDWNQTAKQVYDFVRGLSPYPGAWTTLKDSSGKETVLKIFRTTKTDRPATAPAGQFVIDRKHLFVCCADCLLQLDELQLAGKKRMDAQSFLNGFAQQLNCATAVFAPSD
jgi:methionyl-tRNA formyltransferase